MSEWKVGLPTCWCCGDYYDGIADRCGFCTPDCTPGSSGRHVERVRGPAASVQAGMSEGFRRVGAGWYDLQGVSVVEHEQDEGAEGRPVVAWELTIDAPRLRHPLQLISRRVPATPDGSPDPSILDLARRLKAGADALVAALEGR